MRKCFLIALSNIRKVKGQTISIIVCIFIAAIMFNLWLMLSMDYKANFKRCHDKLNAQHVTVTIDDNDGEAYNFFSKLLENDNRVSQYHLDRCMYMTASFAYNDGELNSWFIFINKDAAVSRDLGQIEIVEEESYISGIYLPMIYKTNDIEVGKPLSVSIGSYTIEYTVCGFFNSVMTGSHNCGLTELILTEDKYAELETLGYAAKSTLCSVRLYDKAENVDFEAELKTAVSKQFPNVNMVSNCYDIVIQARYISQMICSAILSAMAFFVLLIALVVIVSNIINYIQVNIKNLGALKAIGYTSKQLIGSLLFQFLGLALIVATIGAGFSYCFFPAVNSMMIVQTGIPYTIHFLPLPLFISLLILGGTVALVVWLASRRIKNIEPIVALRSGVQSHNFKHNHFPIERTKASLNLTLALKTTFADIKYNITICITMLVLSLVVVFSGLMTENVITDMTPFLNLIVGETANSCISVNVDFEEEFLQEMLADNRVEKAYLYTTINVTHSGGAELLTTICDDFSKVNNQDVVYKGRFPKYENEIAIGAKYAKEKGLTVGNEILITANGKTERFLISGLTQVTNYLGRDGLLTRQGYERLGTLISASYYINLVSGTDIDAYNAEMRVKFAENVNAVINIDSTIDAVAIVYVSLMTIIVIAILILSAIIIAFVLYLLVRTMLNNKKRDFGILKSLGFTSKQLILQTALSFMPAIIFSTIVGIIVSSITINPLMSVFLSGLGIVKCTFAIPILFIVIAGVLLVLFAFALLCLLSLKIKKISPYQILVGE